MKKKKLQVIKKYILCPQCEDYNLGIESDNDLFSITCLECDYVLKSGFSSWNEAVECYNKAYGSKREMKLFSFPVKEKEMRGIKIIVGNPIINFEALPLDFRKEKNDFR
jgi:transcription elongation factor Elf1